MIQIAAALLAAAAIAKLYYDNRRMRHAISRTGILLDEILAKYSEVLAEEIEEFLGGAA